MMDVRRLIEAVAATVIEHADELTTLDQAIGDGDHGLNMKRGFEAVRGELGTGSWRPWAGHRGRCTGRSS